ncbi:hypothetical protein F0562_011845 [Nyssa sinensis]|uniref:Uncharacterized protein n=1 Tax=Nyssa sinensis TaxID=561372 RepID=A0A5J4ZU53_9ASTE|nr:hypothetical protein F0562_011845 [Nyssa sinensis]
MFALNAASLWISHVLNYHLRSNNPFTYCTLLSLVAHVEDIPSLGDVNFENFDYSGKTVGEDSDEQAGHVEVEEEEEDQESDGTLVSTLAQLDEEI